MAAFGSGLTGTLGAARLLFGMGRDGVLPRKFFGYLKPGSSTPTYNILLIGGVSFSGAVLLNYIGSAYQHAGELLNFGAFLAFMGVNFACFWQFSVQCDLRANRFVFFATRYCRCSGLSPVRSFGGSFTYLAKIVGGIWFAIGILYVGYKTNWFRSAPVMIDFSDQ